MDPARDEASGVGDEALLLARAAPTWVARDRVAGARAAMGAGAELLVMDDGFQNPWIAKDLSVLVVDGAYGFGNRRVMPAGPLRESVAAGLARADAVALMGEDECAVSAKLEGGLPVLRARLVARGAAARLRGRKVLAFAGIARPAKFFAMLEALGAEVVEAEAFPDHHAYGAAEIEALVARAAALGAVPVTTEKDAVRLAAELRAGIEVLPVAVQWNDPEAVDRLLDRVLG